MTYDASTYVSGELRAHMGRRRITVTGLAETLQVHRHWLTRRLGGQTPYTIDDLVDITAALGITLAELLPNMPSPGRDMSPVGQPPAG